MLLLFPSLVNAHPEWKEANCLGVIDENSKLELTIKFDIPSYLLGQTPKDALIKDLDELMNSPSRLSDEATKARGEFPNKMRLAADGQHVPLQLISFPTDEQIKTAFSKQGVVDRYPVLLNARLLAKIPKQTSRITLRFPDHLGTVFVNLRKGMDYQVVMACTPNTPAELTLSESPLESTWQLYWILFIDGFLHVIPKGWDHTLFMIAMFLSAKSLWEAFRRSLVFTAGHCITLTAVAMGFINTPSEWIEPLIALTIAISAWLAYRGRLNTSPAIFITSTFGLIHGLGFASAISSSLSSWSSDNIALILLGFNLGIEFAQVLLILFVAGAFSLLNRAMTDVTPARRAICLTITITGLLVFTWRVANLA